MSGLKYIKPHVQELFRAHGGRVTIDEGVDYIIEHGDPIVIAAIQRQALRNVMRAAFRQFGAEHREDNLPGVINVGEGTYSQLTFTTLPERLAVIAKYNERSGANAAIRDALAADTLQQYGDTPNIESLVKAARLGIIEIEAAA